MSRFVTDPSTRTHDGLSLYRKMARSRVWGWGIGFTISDNGAITVCLGNSG